MKNLLIIAAIILFCANKIAAQALIPAKDVAMHIGENITICDTVFDQDNKAFVVTLFLGGHRPKEYFTVAIRLKDQSKAVGFFNSSFIGKVICVTGKVLKSRGTPYIRVNQPEQIKLLLTDNTIKVPAKAG